MPEEGLTSAYRCKTVFLSDVMADEDSTARVINYKQECKIRRVSEAHVCLGHAIMTRGSETIKQKTTRLFNVLIIEIQANLG